MGLCGIIITMQTPLNYSQLKSLRLNKHLLIIMLFAVILQTSFRHHTEHSIQAESLCLTCLSQANLDSGLVINEILVTYKTNIFESISISPLKFNSQPVTWFRNRSPPIFS